MSRLYNNEEIASALGVSVKFVRQQKRRGNLRSLHSGYVTQRDLDAWIQIHDAEIQNASEYLTSEFARLVQLELYGDGAGHKYR